MKRALPWILLAIFAAIAFSGFRSPKAKEGFNTAEFGRLPVLLNGRVQPFDSVGKNLLLSMSGKSVVRTRDKGILTPTEWVLEAMTRPADADTRKIFRVQHPDLEVMLGTEKIGLEYYALNDLTNHLDEISSQVERIRDAEGGMGSSAQSRTPFQKDLFNLYERLVLFQRIKNSLQPEGSRDFAHEVAIFKESVGPGLEALRANQANEDHNKEDLQMIAAFFRRYQSLSNYAYPLIIPPTPDEPRDGWQNIGSSLMASMRSDELHPAVTNFAAIASAYSKNEPQKFNQAIVQYKAWLQANKLMPEIKKGRQEFFFNQIDLFYKAMIIYVGALLAGCIFWVTWSEPVRKSAFWLLLLAFVVHTASLVFRMYLHGRPPVTNLYSSAIFVGWGAVVLGITLEAIFKRGIGVVAASIIGFTTQLIAHHLAMSGDTMEMLQAVLDTNFWLATHVVIITIGYASMFLAGLLAIIYIFLGFFTRNLTADLGKALSRAVYGIVCFATLFSFVGTILGGIWADQSWGRFWGWDPKENGALMIVIWAAIILHARWGGLVRERGIMALAVFGNIVTAFSWFGVNMLGIGLHSYGFMDEAFFWLMLFMVSQVLLIGLAMTPLRLWASFKWSEKTPGTPDKPVATAV